MSRPETERHRMQKAVKRLNVQLDATKWRVTLLDQRGELLLSATRGGTVIREVVHRDPETLIELVLEAEERHRENDKTIPIQQGMSCFTT